MLMLNPEQVSQVFAKLNETSQTEVPSSTPETNTVAPQTSETKVETQSTSDHLVKTEDRSVPYERFKEVNDRRKSYQTQLEEQKKEIERLKGERNKPSQTSQEDDWLDNLLRGDDEEKPSKNPKDKEFTNLDKRLKQFELKEAERELDSIVSQAKKSHSDINPDLLETVIYKAISENPQADIEDAVENLRTFISFVKTSGQASPVPVTTPEPVKKPAFEAAPRPSLQGTKQYFSDDIKKPTSVSEAREALYKYLKTNKL